MTTPGSRSRMLLRHPSTANASTPRQPCTPRGLPLPDWITRFVDSAITRSVAGMCSAVLDEVERDPHPGIVLHWFNGSTTEIRRAVEMQCFFSANAVMKYPVLEQIPMDKC